MEPESPSTTYEDQIMRSAAGLGEFRPPSQSVTPGELQLGKKKQKEEDLEKFQLVAIIVAVLA